VCVQHSTLLLWLHVMFVLLFVFFFFFQAEDGIRDGHVTGVQTCALPISTLCVASSGRRCPRWRYWRSRVRSALARCPRPPRSSSSEERRVGKEWRSRGARRHEKNNE